MLSNFFNNVLITYVLFKDEGYDVFISYRAGDDDSKEIYNAVSTFMNGLNFKVFNPTMNLATDYDKATVAAMQDAVKKSKIVFAALSDGFFQSPYCEKEIEAAKESGIKVIPVYSGDYYARRQIIKWIEEFNTHSTFEHVVFKEQVQDVLNQMHSNATNTILTHLGKLVHMKKIG